MAKSFTYEKHDMTNALLEGINLEYQKALIKFQLVNLLLTYTEFILKLYWVH